MVETTYDPEADAVYVRFGPGDVNRTEDVGSFTVDFDSKGRVIGIEMIGATAALVPGAWRFAPLPSASEQSAAE